MRHSVLAALLLLAIGTAGGGEPGQSGTTTDPNTAQPPTPPKPVPQVRQAEDSDFVVGPPKEWHSPITFDIDATWLQTLKFGYSKAIKDLPVFYCDGVTISRLDITRYGNWGKSEEFQAEVTFDARPGNDKSVDLEFTLISGTRKLLLCRIQNENVDEGKSTFLRCDYSIKKVDLGAFTADGASPQLRMTMAVHN